MLYAVLYVNAAIRNQNWVMQGKRRFGSVDTELFGRGVRSCLSEGQRAFSTAMKKRLGYDPQTVGRVTLLQRGHGRIKDE